MPRVIVLGDVHGCLSELQKLVCETNYKAGEDRLIVAVRKHLIERTRINNAENDCFG